MLNRLTVSALLKAVIAITSVCVVIALSLTAYKAWDRLKTANRICRSQSLLPISQGDAQSAPDRSTTVRLLNATEPMDGEIEKYLRALRDAQMPAMARAIELLPALDFPQSGRQQLDRAPWRAFGHRAGRAELFSISPSVAGSRWGRRAVVERSQELCIALNRSADVRRSAIRLAVFGRSQEP